MKSALLKTFGDAEEITVGEVNLRDLQPNEAVVSVEVAGANPLDLKIIAGYMQQVFPVEFPYVPGTDFSGVVDAVGTNVTHMSQGDRVFGRTAPGAGGAFGRHLVIAATDLCVIPSEMSFEQAAALPTAFGTARQALFDVGHLRQGQRVLIHAGAGGVGSMAIQQAHHAGARVIATASARNVELVKSLGADEVIDYRTEDFTQVRDIDLVLDTIGGETLEKSWSVLMQAVASPASWSSISSRGVSRWANLCFSQVRRLFCLKPSDSFKPDTFRSSPTRSFHWTMCARRWGGWLLGMRAAKSLCA